MINSAYKNNIKLDLDKLKNNQIQHVKVDLTKMNITTFATQLGVLSEYVKLYMKLLTSKIYYDLNGRTINLLMKYEIDMSVVVGQEAIVNTISDAELVAIIAQEREVEIVVVDENKTRACGSSFPYINDTIFDLTKYDIFVKKQVDRRNYKHNCLYLALQAGGLSDIKLQ